MAKPVHGIPTLGDRKAVSVPAHTSERLRPDHLQSLQLESHWLEAEQEQTSEPPQCYIQASPSKLHPTPKYREDGSHSSLKTPGQTRDFQQPQGESLFIEKPQFPT